MKKPKLPPKSVSPMAADTQGEMPPMQPKPTMMAPQAAPVAPKGAALPQKTHNPANLLPPGAFHGSKR